MAFSKYARAEVVEVRRAPSQVKTASLATFSDLGVKLSSEEASEKLEEILDSDGWLYLKTRAISSRNNKNNDAWSSDELKKAYSTFLGKPFFIEHHNYDPKRARGVVVDASVHVDEDGKTASLDPFYSSADSLPEHKPPTWIDCLVEIDAKSFPRLAHAILSGEIDAVSMGANVGFTICSVCDNKAEDAAEFCEHIRLKGARFDWPDENGEKVSKLAYERCGNVSFFELSGVADPADETALMYQDTIKQASVKESGPLKRRREPDIDELPEWQDMSDLGYPDSKSEWPEGLDEEVLGPDLSDEEWAQLERDNRARNKRKAAVDPATGQSRCSLCGSPTAGAEICDACKAQQTPEQQQAVQADPLAQLQAMAKVITFKSDEAAEDFLKVAERPKPPRSEEITAPPKIDTLEQDSTCEICGSDMEDGSCVVCSWTIPPDGFDHPDLEKAQKVDKQMRDEEAEQELAQAQIERVEDSKKQPAPENPREKRAPRPGRPPARASSAGGVISEKLANRGGDQGRINVREKPIMPPGERHSDKPLKAVTISDQHRPVESSKGNDMSKKQAIQTGADTQVDVTGAGAALTDVSPLKVVDVEAVGGIVAEGEAATQDVAKDVDVTGSPTDTWSSGEDQESAVTDEKGEGLQTVKDAAAVSGPDTPKPADTLDVNTPIGDEEVGDDTDTWSSAKGQEKPVTTEKDENLTTVARRHAFACMKLAEAEIELGITDADEKYQRVAELEDEGLDTIEAQLKTLAKVHTAGLRPAPQRRKLTASRMPSMRTASAPVSTDTPDVENSFFL